MVASAVIVPALLYVGRHSWPTTRIVNLLSKCIHNFVWFGCFEESVSIGRAWMSPDIAVLARKEGGIALPSLKAELVAMAAVTVATWATSSSPVRRLVGDILSYQGYDTMAAMQYVTPGYNPRPIAGFGPHTTLFTVGITMVSRAGAQPSPPEHKEIVLTFLEVVTWTIPLELVWVDNTTSIDCQALLGEPSATCRNFLRRHFGELRSEWLGFMNLQILRQLPGVTHTDVHAWESAASSYESPRINQIFRWTLTHTGVITFTDVTDGVLSHRRRLIVVLLANFPELLYSLVTQNELRITATPLNHPITAQITDMAANGTIVVSLRASAMEPTISLAVTSENDLLSALRKYAGDDVQITAVHPHPTLSRFICMWAGGRRWKQTRRGYKHAAILAQRRRGLLDVRRRSEDWKTENATIGQALATLSWTDIRNMVGISPWREQLLLRLKLRAFSRWDPIARQPGCVIEECGLSDTSVTHIFWDCPGARTLWQIFFSNWKDLGMMEADLNPKVIFGFRITAVPDSIWSLFESLYRTNTPKEREAIQQHVHDVVASAWSTGVVVTLQAIWTRRTSYYDTARSSTIYQASALLTGRLYQTYTNIRVLNNEPQPNAGRCEASKLVCSALLGAQGTGRPTIPVSFQDNHVVLFFNGGSRGNPGPGGAGSILISLPAGATSHQVLWMSSISLASKRTTNNIAEYRGLYAGLQRAMELRLSRIHVVGDSSIILTQLRSRHHPRVPHLCDLYTRCRGIADRIHVCSWTHHLRSYNKAAYKLANIAMDDCVSRHIFLSDQIESIDRWAQIVRMSDGDIEHWRDAYLTTGIDMAVADGE